MKKLLLFTLFFCGLIAFAEAQTDIRLKVNHLLDQQDFAFEQGAVNNMGDDFNVTRLEYYISGLKIIHDGGAESAFPNHYILANGGIELNEVIGNADIQQVEGIKFSIGVDPGVNNGDPALWPAGHPLAPRFPSMHWGWASGYRFIAIEGFGGAQYNQLYQLHGLGNDNYFEVDIALDASAASGEVLVELNADYTKILENIGVAGGLIVHGDYDEAKESLENMRDYVFSPAATTSNRDLTADLGGSIYPNPSLDGIITVQSELMNEILSIEVLDAFGRTIQTVSPGSLAQVNIWIPTSGNYWIKLMAADSKFQLIPAVVK